MQQQAGLAGCLGLLAQGGEPGQDAAIAAALGAPFRTHAIGGVARGRHRMGVAVAEVGKLNRHTQGSVLLRKKSTESTAWGGIPARRQPGR